MTRGTTQPDKRSLSETVDASTPADVLLEATLPEPSAHRRGRAAVALQLIAADPVQTGASIWVAAATGDVESVRRWLAEDPSLAIAQGGTRHWDPLLYLSFSTLLHHDDAIAERMLNIARLLLDAGADPNTFWIDSQEAEGNRETPLYGAAGVANHVELARLLIERGADPNDGETAYHMVEHPGVPCAEFIFPKLQPMHQGTALAHLLDYDDYEGLHKLLQLGADPNGPNPFNSWPLHQAVWRDREIRFFDLLLSFGADLDKPNGEGRTAYAMAARSGKQNIMDWLTDAGASTDLGPVAAFIAACAAGDRQQASALLAAQPDLKASFTPRDHCEICEAASSGQTGAVGTMLAMGWDVNARGVVWNETPAHRAALAGHLETLQLVVAQGADLTLLDRSYNSSPLGWAQHEKRQEIIDYLRTLPDRLDLWDAIELGLTDRALELLPQTDPNIALRGAAPGVLLRLAATYGNRRLVEALLERGVDPTLETPYGATAILVAREAGHEDLAELMDSARPV